MKLRRLGRMGRSERIVFLAGLGVWLSACVVVGLNAAAARGWPEWAGATIGGGGGLAAFLLLNLPKTRLAGSALIWPGIALGFLLVLGGRGLLATRWPWGALLYVLLVLFGGPLLMFGGIRLAEILGGKLGKEPSGPEGE